MKAYMDLYTLIAAEFGVWPPDTTPLYQLQYMASMAENRRNDKMKAAEKGLTYIG